MRLPAARARRQAGISYVEVLVATAVLALALVPALEGLEVAIRGGEVHESRVTLHHHLVAKLEEVLARPFADLEAEANGSGGAPSADSDPGGAPDRRLVYLLPYDGDDADADGDPFTGGDPELVWVRVEVEATPYALETLAGP